MKKIFLITGLLSLVVLFSVPTNASAGVSIDGLNGGNNWSGQWSLGGGTSFVENSPSAVAGDRSLYVTGDSTVMFRSKPSSPDGIVSFRIRSGNTYAYSGISFTDSGGGGANGNRFGIAINNPNYALGSGHLTFGDGQSTENEITTITPDTWYKISIKYGHVPGKFAVSLNNGPYGDDYDMGPGNNSLIDGLVIFANYNQADFWVDDIEYQTLASSTVTTSENFDTYQNTSITASAGANGSISPSEILNASVIGNYTFTITPDSGFQVSDVIVDGLSVGPTNSYTFNGLTNTDHTISASFSANTGGSGTVNRISKFITSSTLGNSLISDNGTDITLTSGNLLIPTGNIGIGTSTPSAKLSVNGDLFANWIKVAANSFGLDTLTSGTLFVGSTTASSIKIGRPSIITTIFGTTTVSNLTASTATISGKLSAGITTLGNTTLSVLNANSVISSGALSAASVTTGTLTATTSATVSKLNTSSNCASSASPAVCGSAPGGSVAILAGSNSVIVNTTAVTANSQIFVTEDQSLGTRLGVTCQTNTGRHYRISARTAGTSFTIRTNTAPSGNPACLSYFIVN